MLEVLEISLALLLGAAVLLWHVADGLVERRERRRCAWLLEPLAGARLRLVGQARTKRYDLVGRYRGRPVRLHCPVVTLFEPRLRVLSVSTPIDVRRLDPVLASGELVLRDGYRVRRYGDALRWIVDPPLRFAADGDPDDFRARVRAELDALMDLVEELEPARPTAA